MKPSQVHYALTELGETAIKYAEVLAAVEHFAAAALAGDVMDPTATDPVVALGTAQVALTQIRESAAHAKARAIEMRAHMALARAAASRLRDPGAR